MCEMMDEIKREMDELKEMVNKVLFVLGGISPKEDKLMTKTELCKLFDVSKPTLNKRLKLIDYKGILVAENERRYEKEKVIEALKKIDPEWGK